MTQQSRRTFGRTAPRLCSWLLVVCCIACSATFSYAQDRANSLAKVAGPFGIEIGGALHSYPGLTQPANLLNLASNEFSAITASVYMPYGVWENQSQNPNLSGFESMVDWATNDGLRVHGHALLYPSANRNLAWFNNLPNDAVEGVLSDFVQRLASSRAGKVWVWDVVNEVIADDGQPMDALGLRTDFKEYSAMGADYVEKAFRWAKAADPNAVLIINDYGAEPENNKSNRLLAFAQHLRNRGVPIDGVGFQTHYFEPTQEPDYDSMRRNFQRFADAGFRLFITEMDVVSKIGTSENDLPNDAEHERQRRIYQEFTRIALEQPAMEALLAWDFVDQESWLHPAVGDNGAVALGDFTFPCIYRYEGGQIVRKPAYYGIEAAFAEQQE